MDCIAVERRPVDCIEPVLRESACRSAAQVVDRSVLSADTDSAGPDLRIEAR